MLNPFRKRGIGVDMSELNLPILRGKSNRLAIRLQWSVCENEIKMRLKIGVEQQHLELTAKFSFSLIWLLDSDYTQLDHAW